MKNFCRAINLESPQGKNAEPVVEIQRNTTGTGPDLEKGLRRIRVKISPGGLPPSSKYLIVSKNERTTKKIRYHVTKIAHIQFLQCVEFTHAVISRMVIYRDLLLAMSIVKSDQKWLINFALIRPPRHIKFFILHPNFIHSNVSVLHFTKTLIERDQRSVSMLINYFIESRTKSKSSTI